ncbi:MAG: hypothetical protein AB8B48_18030 [Pseudomonadales bacterium]
MNHSPLKILANIFRILLLVGVVAAGAVWSLWESDPVGVDEYGEELADDYLRQYQKAYNEAVSPLEEEDGDGDLEPLRNFVVSLEHVRKSDRLDPLKRRTIRRLITELRAQGANEEALRWTQEWLALDDRDVVGLSTQAEILTEMPGRNSEGLAAFAALHHKLPALEMVSLPYSIALAKAASEPGDLAKAYAVFEPLTTSYLDLQGELTGLKWEVLWDTGKSFSGKQKKIIPPVVDKNARVSVTFELEPNVKRLRIDPPIKLRARLTDMQVHLLGSSPAPAVNIVDQNLKLNQIAKEGDALITSGSGDPYFFFELPERFQSEKKTRMRFEVTVSKRFPDTLAPLMTAEAAEEILPYLHDRGDTAAMLRYKKLYESQHGELSNVLLKGLMAPNGGVR